MYFGKIALAGWQRPELDEMVLNVRGERMGLWLRTLEKSIWGGTRPAHGCTFKDTAVAQANLVDLRIPRMCTLASGGLWLVYSFARILILAP